MQKKALVLAFFIVICFCVQPVSAEQSLKIEIQGIPVYLEEAGFPDDANRVGIISPSGVGNEHIENLVTTARAMDADFLVSLGLDKEFSEGDAESRFGVYKFK